MKRSTTTLRLAALASASALVLAACGGGDDSSDDKDKEVAKGDGEFVVGSLLPQTGSLAFLGPPEFAGVDLAVKEINEAGGVLGKPARHVKGDSGDTDSGIAPTETDKLIKAGSDVIVGAASSGVSMTVIDKILGAGVVQYSPANTSTDFDTGKYDKPDLYFRTAPSDILQGAVMANLLVEDNRQNVAILARQDSYGETLAQEVKKGLEAAGSKVAVTSFYGEKAPSYDAQVDDVAAAKPDAVVLIAFDETKKIIPQLVGKGVGPQDVATYFVDGNVADYSGDGFAAQLKGVKGTVPGAEAAGDFKKRLLSIDPKLKDYSYAAESYDAVVTSALAAIAAKNDSGEAVASELVEVTKGGEKCTTFKQCADLLADGKDIDYDGVSGPIEMGETGSPTSASIGIYQYNGKGTYDSVKYIAGDI
ncbi:ABC transporter substrate-binding protein [Aeromicrobium sp. 636]|uniref:ABC transporter substrate-binding protein n=1 Tax=Aeromicrobium senzhongii TaxID=2663859 RepID=A0A8I0K1P7_9ACTN|nr:MULTISPECIES: ABC transporter substrate-binding protein [Aeromicrobium]MBC9224815.1 ABC transporter substrate-binding protein [Aeromicrobium senzhongii]MCQ3996928.1 ABC transporter substrate-binding protein [Aeromicrobium sp. 636]MTB86862.1 ABC transporter substrate-binding protein [Aeromicrobium senzhongii]QNL93303.1 ABC transporter substrate-binding protein [Aeromicrobium senzhongii]